MLFRSGRPATQSLAYVAHVHEGGRVLFDNEKQPREIQAYVNSGHMKCCVRDDHDLEDEVYPKYYDDFPLDPMCIPGYRKDGDDCIACDEGYYCPAKEDRVMKCPEQTWAPLGSGEVTECWCAEGYYGKEPSLQAGADCHKCPVDKFCPGHMIALDCPPEKTITECLKFPYVVQHWPGEQHDCPAGSSTRGLHGQVNCTCTPGHWKAQIGRASCRERV